MRLQLPQRVGPVEHADVFRLDLSQSPYGPSKMNVVRFFWLAQREHAALLRQPVPLPRVAGGTGSDDVRPNVRTALRQRDQVIASETFAKPELIDPASAVLTLVIVACKQERIRNLPAELARHVHVSNQANHGGLG